MRVSWISGVRSRRILTILVVAMGAVLFLSTFGDATHAPGGMDSVHFGIVELAMMMAGIAVGYGRQGGGLALFLLVMLAVTSPEIFTAGLYRSVLRAPLAAIAWWTFDLLFGLGGGYLARLKDAERRTSDGK